MAAATAMIWLTAGARKLLTGGIPGLLLISGLVLTLQTALVLVTGSTLLFLLQFPVANLALCILFARTAPTGKPLVAQLAAEVVALRQPGAAHPGLDRFFRGVTWLWAGIFAASPSASVACSPSSRPQSSSCSPPLSRWAARPSARSRRCCGSPGCCAAAACGSGSGRPDGCRRLGRPRWRRCAAGRAWHAGEVTNATDARQGRV